MFERFTRAFGAPPTSVGAYIIDAWTLRHIRRHYPSVRIAVTNCFEEGVKMYQGNNQNWMLFSDGGPWAPFRPAASSALCPARDAEEDLGIIAVPHLNRDMIMALVSRDDLFASHPLNLMRAMINDGDRCDYNFRFIGNWIEQAAVNGWSYYSLFVSTPWIAPNNIFAPDVTEARSLYTQTLEYLRDRQNEGKVEALTMSGFAERFSALSPPGDGHACHWRCIIGSPKRQMVWFANSHYRAAVDLNVGGTICDLRPYASRQDRDLGPDTPSLWNGNYPYVIAAHLRGGHWNTGVTCRIRIGDHTASVDSKRTAGKTRREGGKWVLELDPIELRVGTTDLTLGTKMVFDAGSAVRIERRVIDCSDPVAQVTLSEVLRGTWGTTEYPQDMHGIVLSAHAADAARELPFEYSAASVEIERPTEVAARVPQVGCRISLRPDGPADVGQIADGTLFFPNYTLSLRKTVRKGESLASWLTIEKL
jgi:hypothetical protein